MAEHFQWTNPALWTQAHAKRIGAILRAHGWVSKPYREGGTLVKGYVKTSALGSTETSGAATERHLTTSNSLNGRANTLEFNSVTGGTPCVHAWFGSYGWAECSRCGMQTRFRDAE